jgi:hypothetical protein
MEGWETAFRRTNKATLMWELVFALLGAGYFATEVPESTDWTNRAPVVVVGAVGMTQAYPARVRERAPAG